MPSDARRHGPAILPARCLVERLPATSSDPSDMSSEQRVIRIERAGAPAVLVRRVKATLGVPFSITFVNRVADSLHRVKYWPSAGGGRNRRRDRRRAAGDCPGGRARRGGVRRPGRCDRARRVPRNSVDLRLGRASDQRIPQFSAVLTPVRQPGTLRKGARCVDAQISQCGQPTTRYTPLRYRRDPRPIGLHPMDIHETHVNTAAFLCVEQGGGAEAKPRATAFFVTDRSGDKPYPVWVVTGRHCIENARATGC